MKSVDTVLDKLQNDAKGEDTSDSFMEPAKKSRGGRPKGSKNRPAVNPTASGEDNSGPGLPPLPDIEQTKKLIRPGVEALSLMGVKLAADQAAAIQPTEMEIIVETGALCVNQYLPGVLGIHANAIVLLVTLSQWSLRVYLLRQTNIQKMREVSYVSEAANVKQ